ncbi:MAG: hypothetical protein Ct9H300mP1_39620 [Planctomycetaceae bacterium]|nr:MAG: hypothetical protein Ct9H300mP1_39620 [Planctomycetaceae bacterium]
MAVVMALGGSTNAVLHLVAIARSAGVDLTIDDFQATSDRVPLLADLKPSGRFVMADLHGVGGTPAVLKFLLAEGLIEGDCLTVTGKTLAENVAELPKLSEGQEIVRPTSEPIKSTGHLRFCEATWHPKGRWPRSPARRAWCSRARHGYSTPKRRCSPRSNRSRSARAMW